MLWIHLVKVLHPTQHKISHFGDELYGANVLTSTEKTKKPQKGADSHRRVTLTLTLNQVTVILVRISGQGLLRSKLEKLFVDGQMDRHMYRQTDRPEFQFIRSLLGNDLKSKTRKITTKIYNKPRLTEHK